MPIPLAYFIDIVLAFLYCAVVELPLRFERHQRGWGHLPIPLADFAAFPRTKGRGKKQTQYHDGRAAPAQSRLGHPQKSSHFALCEARGAQLQIRLEELGTDGLR